MAYYHRYRGHAWAAGRVLFLAAAVIALIIVLHIFFVLVGANPNNAFVSTDASWAWHLAAWFRDLFNPSNYKLAVFLDYGIAAAFYLLIGRLAERLVDRI